jgi:hypothetical protein
MRRILIVSVIMASMIISALFEQAFAGEKVYTGSSAWQIFGPQEEMTLLEASVKVTGKKADLIIDFSAECAFHFGDYDYITNFLLDYDYLEAITEVWVEVDGNPVPVDPWGFDNGVVIFGHVYQSQYNWVGTWGGDAQTTTIENQWERYRSASSFKWIALNVSTGIHNVRVQAILHEFTGSLDGNLDSIIGRRTLIVEQVNAGQ